MSLTTYAELQTAVASELHRSDLTSYIPDFISRAESKINAKLRVRQMETTMSTVVASGVVAVPTNYIEMISSYVTSTTPYVPLDRRDQGWIYDHFPDRSAAETPGFIAREGSNFIFGPSPADGITVKINYYNRLAALSTSTNSVFTAYPGLWLYGALLEAEGFLKNDKRIPLWAQKFAELMKMVQEEDDVEEFSGSTLMVRPG